MSSVNFPARAGVCPGAPIDHEPAGPVEPGVRRSAFKPVAPGLGGLQARNDAQAGAGDFQYADAPRYHFGGAGQQMSVPFATLPQGRPVSPVLPEYPNIQFIGENPMRPVMGPDGNVRLRSFRDDMRDVFRELDSVPPGHDLLVYTNHTAQVRKAENQVRTQLGQPPLPPLDCLVELRRNAGAQFRPFAPPGPAGVGGIVSMDPAHPLIYPADIPGEARTRNAVIAGHELIHHNEAVHGRRGNEHKTAGVEEGYDINENVLREAFGDPRRETYLGRPHILAPELTMHNVVTPGTV